MKIFELNIERLEEIEEQRSKAKGHRKLVVVKNDIFEFAKTHFEKYEKSNGMGRWNGRQIRNAFLIAYSLAHYEGESQPELQKQLRSSHFNVVDETTMLYDQYRSNIFGKTDDALAYDREERDAPITPPVGRSSMQPQLVTRTRCQASNMNEGFLQGMVDFRIHNSTHMEEQEVVKVRNMFQTALEGSQAILSIGGAGGIPNLQQSPYGGAAGVQGPQNIPHRILAGTPVQNMMKAPVAMVWKGPKGKGGKEKFVGRISRSSVMQAA
ncbi:hypothetical protein F4804DRAFT_335500 [Jackrogersella minutella]|nr:hypothetical protein F4804DRAFT_335500 [Jackrogersella minutella]